VRSKIKALKQFQPSAEQAGSMPAQATNTTEEPIMATEKRSTNATGLPVADNINILTAGPRGPALLQDIWLIEIYT